MQINLGLCREVVAPSGHQSHHGWSSQGSANRVRSIKRFGVGGAVACGVGSAVFRSLPTEIEAGSGASARTRVIFTCRHLSGGPLNARELEEPVMGHLGKIAA